MKKILAIFILFMISLDSNARIIFQKERLYLQSNGEQRPLSMVNELIQKNAISKVKIYDNGGINLISFSTRSGEEKIYSVDEKGFVYSIAPFTNFSISRIGHGLVEFKQFPGRQYRIDRNGYFLY